MTLTIPKTIKMIITDFDGIVTDNCIYINEEKSISRKLNFKDIMAFSLLKKNGIMSAIISGEKNVAIELLAEKFDIKEVHQDIRIKIDVLRSIIERYDLKPHEYLYIGDDINDLECLNFAQIKITVPNCVDKVRAVKDIQITTQAGGNGAFREVVDAVLD